MRHLIPLILATTTALAGVAQADALRDSVASQFKPLPSTIPAVKDNPVTPEKIDPADAQGLRAGQLVDITPDDTRRGVVRGRLHVVAADRVVVRPSPETSSAQLVHFPRLGYRVTPLA